MQGSTKLCSSEPVHMQKKVPFLLYLLHFCLQTACLIMDILFETGSFSQLFQIISKYSIAYLNQI